MLALTACALAAVGLERALRAHGHRPTVIDDPVLWALARTRVSDDPHAVVFVGSSRLALALDADEFARLVPDRRATQLAINGVPGLGVLEDLARDDRFRGLVVLDVAPWELSREDGYTAAADWVRRGRALWRAPGAIVNRMLSLPAQARVAALGVGGRVLLASALSRRRLPEPSWTTMRADRITTGHYEHARPDALAKRTQKAIDQLPTPLAAGPWRAAVARLGADVEAIRARGGDVVFVHMPITGALAAAVDRQYPAHEFWAPMLRQIRAEGLEILQHPEMMGVTCPDGMHLDSKDQARFTRAVVAGLRAIHAL